MKIGMTGNRNGMSEAAVETFKKYLETSKYTELHHGDCVGADADAHDIAIFHGIPTVGHPPEKPELRAYKDCDELWPEAPYFVRNRAIVDNVDLMFGFPGTMQETKRGGTWYTIRYAKKQLRPLIIIWPDGSTEVFNH